MASKVERVQIGVRTENYKESYFFYDKSILESLQEANEKNMFKMACKKSHELRMSISVVVEGVELESDRYVYDRKLLNDLLSVEGVVLTRVLNVLSALRYLLDHPEMEIEDFENVVRARDLLKASKCDTQNT